MTKYIRGEQVAFKDLKAGNIYYLDDQTIPVEALVRSKDGREVAFSHPRGGLGIWIQGYGNFYEAVEKPRPTVHRCWVNFYRKSDGFIGWATFSSAEGAEEAKRRTTWSCIGTAIAEFVENPPEGESPDGR